MFRRKPLLAVITILLLITLAISACAQQPIEVTPDINTRVAQTLMALATPVTPETPTPSETLAPPTDIPTVTASIEPSNTPEPTETPSPSETSTTAPEATATLPSGTPPTAPPHGGQVYFDDFSSETGWYVNQGQNATFEFADGGYQITNNLVNGQFWSVRTVEPIDIILEVDAKHKAGPDDGYYGLVCRHQEDGKNYYALVIGKDGFYGIAMMLDGAFSFLAGGQDDKNIINTEDGAFNRVRGECVRDRLTIYANNQFLLEFRDDTFASGQLGMFNGTREDAGQVVLYDNFAVYAP
jgi:hypothetical protein